MSFWDAATNWGTALDGWVGAVVGAVASFGVAVWVLYRTLKHEREQFREQMEQGRDQFIEQLEKERDLVIEQRRMEAFGDFVAAMNEYLSFSTDPDELRTIQRSTDAALQRWMLYVLPEDEALRAAVSERRSAIVERVGERAKRDRLEEALVRTQDDDVRAAVADLAKWGRVWHNSKGERETAALRLERQPLARAGAVRTPSR